MESPPPRLDGWKAIAAYLGRDERTAQRWRERGLPVHFIPGGRRGTVFAFTAEIDDWLRQRPDGPEHGPHNDDALPSPPPSSRPVATEAAPGPGERSIWISTRAAVITTAMGLLMALGVGLGFRAANGHESNATAQILRAEVTPFGLVAWTADGNVAFSVPTANLIPSDVSASWLPTVGSGTQPVVADLDGDGATEVIVSLWFHVGQRIATDEVQSYSAVGALQWRYRPERRLRYGGRTFEGPWVVRDQLVVPDDNGRGRLLLAVVHDALWPSFVVSLDASGAERLHLVHAGHLSKLHRVWTPAGALVLAAGVNREYESTVLAALDLGGAPVQSPQSHPDFWCTGCGGSTTAPFLLFPRTELSRLLGHPHELGVRFEDGAAGIQIGIEEIPGAEAWSHYRLSADVEPVSTWMSDAYWAMHRQMETRGELGHPVDDCEEGEGQRVRIWTGAGWRESWVHAEDALQ